MFSDHLKNRYPAIKSLVSYGPCQWPTLGFVFDQYDKIEVSKCIMLKSAVVKSSP